jgi:hypothetical protein
MINLVGDIWSGHFGICSCVWEEKCEVRRSEKALIWASLNETFSYFRVELKIKTNIPPESSFKVDECVRNRDFMFSNSTY